MGEEHEGARERRCGEETGWSEGAGTERSLPGPPSPPGFRHRRRALVELLDSVKDETGGERGKEGRALRVEYTE